MIERSYFEHSGHHSVQERRVAGVGQPSRSQAEEMLHPGGGSNLQKKSFLFNNSKTEELRLYCCRGKKIINSWLIVWFIALMQFKDLFRTTTKIFKSLSNIYFLCSSEL